jgi:1-deoxy-D-xylulose-5-phosphate reductoisomerase
MLHITPEEAVKHPNWRMGHKISVDCATLINKGLELIEASRLFSIPPAKINIVIHPESIIHGLINYKDGSTLAQLSIPNMRTPISYSLFYPNRLELAHKELDLTELTKLHFESPDYTRFPLLKLAVETADRSQSEIIALNVANEVAVNAFLSRKIKFLDIYTIIRNTLEQFVSTKVEDLSDVSHVSNVSYTLALNQLNYL